MYDRGEYIHLNQDVLKTSWRRLLKTKAKDIFKAPLAGRMFVGRICVLYCSGHARVSLSWACRWGRLLIGLSAMLRGVRCVCVGRGVVGGGRRGVSVRGSRGDTCAGAYFLMGLRACGFVALCNNPIGFRHRNPTSTYQFITNNYPTIKKSPNIMNMIIGMTASKELHSFC